MCSKGTFECQKILECIDEDRKCDGEPDCRDMTDEKYCKSYTTVCLSVYPSVPSSVCLSVSLCPSLSLIKGTSKNLYNQRHGRKIVIKPYRSVPLDDSPSTNINTLLYLINHLMYEWQMRYRQKWYTVIVFVLWEPT